jgi:protein O-mannosyl-transferase
MARSSTAAELLEGHGLFLLFAFALAVSTAVYWPALSGPPISDDFAYLLNPWITNPSGENLKALVDPWSQATSSLKNYAPVRAFVHSFQWWAHPQVSLAYHLENLVVHALATTLLAAFLFSVGVRATAALVAGAIFLVHPANVEAVAWMSQIWSPLALLFVLLALLALSRRPALATVSVALALLSKPMAVFAAPAAAVLAWCSTGGAASSSKEGTPPRWAWIALWFLLTLLFTAAQVAAYGDSGPRQLNADRAVVVRSMATYALRYLVMAYTSYGVAAFQEPPLSLSVGDPFTLAALLAVAALAVRLVVTLRRRSAEAVGWVWSAAAFAPVSQIFPFLYPVADRYLYFMLPGILLASCIAGQDLLERFADPRWRLFLSRGLLALGLGATVLFGVRSSERVRLWRSEDALMADSARAYPDGVSSLVLRAQSAALQGDTSTTITLLRTASQRDWDYWNFALASPAFQQVRDDPRFKALIADLAEGLIKKVERRSRPTQLELLQLAQAHEIRGETEAAAAAIDRGLALGGPLDGELRTLRASLNQAGAAR